MLTRIPPRGMIEQKLENKIELRNVCDGFRQRILSYIDQVTAAGDSDWPFYENPDSTESTDLETAVWAVMTLRLIDAAQRLDPVRDRIVRMVDRYYDPQTGLYEQPGTQKMGGIGAWRMHNNGCCREMLDLLCVEARPVVRGLDQLRYFPWAPQPGDDIDAWLATVWDYNPRAGAKEIYQYLELYCMLQNIETYEQFDDHVWRIVEVLESRRDPATGFVGMGEGVELGWAMRGHRNLMMGFYWRHGLGEPHLERMIDSTLACLNDEGLFHDGSMCANMDAVQLLSEYGLRSSHRCEQSLAAIRGCVTAVFDIMSVPSGGFRYLRDECPDVEIQGYGSAKLTNGTAFVLLMLRYWQAIDDDARNNLCAAMAMKG